MILFQLEIIKNANLSQFLTNQASFPYFLKLSKFTLKTKKHALNAFAGATFIYIQRIVYKNK